MPLIPAPPIPPNRFTEVVELAARLKTFDYRCEAGPLESNSAYRRLLVLAATAVVLRARERAGWVERGEAVPPSIETLVDVTPGMRRCPACGQDVVE